MGITQIQMKRIGVIVVAALAALMAYGIPARPVPAQFVADLADIFPDKEKVAELEDFLGSVSDSTGVQIQIVTVSDLEGDSPFHYAYEIGEKWGVGDAKKNNGVVILLKPRNETKGEVFIATGSGSECILTDAECSLIIDNYMYEYLVDGQYFEAADAAARVCARCMVNGNDELYSLSQDDDDDSGVLWLLLVFLAPFVGILLYQTSPRQRAISGIVKCESKEQLDKAMAYAQKVGLDEKRTQVAMENMKEARYKQMRQSCSPEHLEKIIATAVGMGLSAAMIENIRVGMKELSEAEYRKCKDSQKLKSMLDRAIAFGNDEERMKALYDDLLKCAKEEEAHQARMSSSSSHSGGHSSGGGRSYGGGHFSGGGAGRSF